MFVSRDRQTGSRFGRSVLGIGALLTTATVGAFAIAVGGLSPHAGARNRAAAAGRGCRERVSNGAARLVRESVARSSAPGVAFLAHRAGPPHGDLQVLTRERRVALSFDDGPSPRYTPRVLRELSRFGVRGTFFVIGAFAARYPGLVQSELCAGDEVENHTWDHPALAGAGTGEKLRFSRAQVRIELSRTRRAIERAGAPAPFMFRPPYGRGVFSRELHRIAAGQGELTVGWDLALDHFILAHRPLRAEIAAMLRHVRPGSIILVHDGQTHRERTLQALPLLLAGLRRRGYEIVPIGTLLHAPIFAFTSGRRVRSAATRS